MASLLPAPDQTSALRDAILQQWGGYGNWNAGEVDRAAELARLLQANGITDISKFSAAMTAPGATTVNEADNAMGSITQKAPDQWAYNFGDKSINGYLGTVNNDNSISGVGTPSQGTKAAWSALGHGNVTYTPKQAPDGSWYIAPQWGSSSDAGTVQDLLKGAALVGGAMLFGPAAGAEAASSTAPLATTGTLPVYTSPYSTAALPELGSISSGAAGLSGLLTPMAGNTAPLELSGQIAAESTLPLGTVSNLPALAQLGSAAAGSGLLGGAKTAASGALDFLKANPTLAGTLLGGLLGGKGGIGGGSYNVGNRTPLTPLQRPTFTPRKENYGTGMPNGLGNQSAGLFADYMRRMGG